MATDTQQTTINFSGVILAIIVIALYWFLAYALVYIKIPEQNSTNLAMVIGVVGNLVGIIIGWYFGSSASNKRQGEIIATQASTIAAAQEKLPPIIDKTIPLAAGETVAVKADEP